MRHSTGQRAYRIGLVMALCGLVAACGDRQPTPQAFGQAFGSAEEAVEALVAAAERYDVPELKTILGPDGEVLVSSEDTVMDRNQAIAFAGQARARQRLDFDSAGTSAVLSIGPDEWPVPIPVVQRDGQWYFDVAAGQEEVLRRRIGANELNAIQVSREYVDAQWAYSLERHDGSIVNQYAQRVLSSPGKQDGLAWRAADGTVAGPLGELIAGYISEGYTDRAKPFHGYYFKILKGQGPDAPLGAMDFLVEGAMLGGFALVASPAEYGVTGIQSFLVGWEGVVYEKDLGETTLDAYRTMELYNPDSTWTPVEAF